MSDGLTCPICDGPLPEPSKRGRPRVYCSSTCRSRARTRVRQAAAMLELADVVEADVGRPGFGSEDYLRRRAAGLRADAKALVADLPNALPGVLLRG